MQCLVGVLIANTPWLVTCYGKYGIHNLLWRLWNMEYGIWKNLKFHFP